MGASGSDIIGKSVSRARDNQFVKNHMIRAPLVWFVGAVVQSLSPCRSSIPHVCVTLVSFHGEDVFEEFKKTRIDRLLAAGPLASDAVAGGGTLEAHARTVRTYTRKYARARGRIPAKVTHIRTCRELCQHVAHPTVWSCSTQITKELDGRATYQEKVLKSELEGLGLVIMILVQFAGGEGHEVVFGIVRERLGQGTALVGMATLSILGLDILNPEVLTPAGGAQGVVSPVGGHLMFARHDNIQPEDCERGGSVYTEGVQMRCRANPPSR